MSAPDPTGDILAAHGPSVLAAYHLIRFEAEQQGACRLGYEGIGARMRCTERSAMRHVKALVDGGWIEARKRHREDGTTLANELLPACPYGVTCMSPQGDIGGDMHVGDRVTSGVTSPPYIPPGVKRPNVVERSSRRSPPQPPHDDDEGFAAFWSTYPRKIAKHDALKAWRRLKPDEATRERMLAALAVQVASFDWQKDGGRFVPHPSTWINGRRWEDEIAPPSPRTNGVYHGPLTDADLERLPMPPHLQDVVEKDRRDFYEVNSPAAPFPPMNLAVKHANLKRLYYQNGGAR